ncbi:hypothetical protein V496_06246 [Pseudogymnoascus sp. VKM F-4515 (FW-2607)]|nr:hypothetical protein V496_06246 [Pseudogymnoascus sp. VKM F-4515 (FW-2607)]
MTNTLPPPVRQQVTLGMFESLKSTPERKFRLPPIIIHRGEPQLRLPPLREQFVPGTFDDASVPEQPTQLEPEVNMVAPLGKRQKLSRAETYSSNPDGNKSGTEENGWTVKYLPKQAGDSKLIKRYPEKAQRHESTFQSTVKLGYIVEPSSWLDMQEHAQCTVGGESYRKNDYVYVRPPNLKHVGDDDNVKFWVAHVLEIRAKSAGHVYAVIAWMYWPDQLVKAHMRAETPKSGRCWYHGKHELVASNHLDILDVECMAGRASVAQWLEGDDDVILEGFYWRQMLDSTTGILSSIRKYCICKKYYNPDLTLIACPSDKCNLWLHEECLVDNALTEAYDALPGENEKNYKKTAKGRPIGQRLHGLSSECAVYSKLLAGKVIENGNGLDDENDIQMDPLLHGPADPLRVWRHIAIAISRKLARDRGVRMADFENDDDDDDSNQYEIPGDPAARHTTKTAESYGVSIDVVKRLTAKSLEIFSRVSYRPHKFLGLIVQASSQPSLKRNGVVDAGEELTPRKPLKYCLLMRLPPKWLPAGPSKSSAGGSA